MSMEFDFSELEEFILLTNIEIDTYDVKAIIDSFKEFIDSYVIPKIEDELFERVTPTIRSTKSDANYLDGYIVDDNFVYHAFPDQQIDIDYYRKRNA